MMKPGRMMLTPKDYKRIGNAMDEHRPDEIYVQYPDGRVSVAVKTTKESVQIHAVVNYDDRTYKTKCSSVDALKSWMFEVRCDRCAYHRKLYNSGAQMACHYLLDNGEARTRDQADTCMSKSDVRTFRNWTLDDLCRPLEVID